MKIKKISKWIGIILCLSASFTLFAGGRQEAPKEVPKAETKAAGDGYNWTKYSGTELNIIGRQWTVDWFRWDQFEAKTGIKVKVDPLGYRQCYEKQMIEFGAKSSTYDIFVSQSEIVNIQYDISSWFEVLDGYLSKEIIPGWDIKQFSPAAVDFASRKGRLLGLPLMVEAPLLFYRTDVFQKNGIGRPQRVEEVLDIAKKLTVKDSKKMTFYGFVARGFQVGPSFSNFLYNMGGALVDEANYKVLFDQPDGVEAAKLYVSLIRDYGPPEVAGADHFGSRPIFEMGQAAMMSDTGALYVWMKDKANSLVHDRFSAYELPPGKGGQKPYLSGWNLQISPFSKKKEAAWLLLQWATSKENMKWMAINKGFCHGIDELWADPDFLASVDKQWASEFRSALQKAKAGRMRPLVLRSREIDDILSTAISKSIEGANVEDEIRKAGREAQAKLDKQKADLAQMMK